MIARRAHPASPRDPSRHVYLPLAYERQSGMWIPLVGPDGYHVTAFDAARACHADWLGVWQDIHRRIRQMRALCEHPELASFAGDGIDGVMLADNARRLASIVEIADVSIKRLLDKPRSDDVVRIGGVLYKADADSGLLTPSGKLEQRKHPPSPNAVFMESIVMALDRARSMTGKSVTARGLENAIDMLILMLPEDDDRPDHRGPMQFIADHRFTRMFRAAMSRALQRTGHMVSIRGLQDTIAVLERIVEDRIKAGNGRGDREHDDGEPTIELERPMESGSAAVHDTDAQKPDEESEEPDEESEEPDEESEEPDEESEEPDDSGANGSDSSDGND